MCRCKVIMTRTCGAKNFTSQIIITYRKYWGALASNAFGLLAKQSACSNSATCGSRGHRGTSWSAVRSCFLEHCIIWLQLEMIKAVSSYHIHGCSHIQMINGYRCPADSLIFELEFFLAILEGGQLDLQGRSQARVPIPNGFLSHHG